MLWAQLGRLGEVGLSLLFIVLVVRWLSESSYSTYTTVINLLNLFGLLFGTGISEGLLRFLPLERQQSPIASFWLFRRLFFVLILASPLPILLLVLGKDWLADWLNQAIFAVDPWLPATLLLLFNLHDFTGTYFVASFRVGRIVLIRFLGQLVNILVLAVWFWFTPPTAEILLASLALVNTGMVLAVLVLLVQDGLLQRARHKGSIIQTKMGELVRYCRDQYVIGLANIGLMGQIDIILLALLASNVAEVSYYSIAALLISRLYNLITGWSASLNSIISTVYLEKGQAGLARYFTYYYRFSLPLHLISVVGLWVVSQPLVTLVFGERYQSVVILLNLFALQQMLMALLGASVCPAFINTLGRQNYMVRLRWLFGLLNVLLDVLLIPSYGALGAVIATSLANVLTRAAEAWLVRELIANLGFAYILKIGAGVAVAGLLCAFIGDAGLVILLVRGTLFVLILFGIFYLIKPVEAADRLLITNLQPRLARFLLMF